MVSVGMTARAPFLIFFANACVYIRSFILRKKPFAKNPKQPRRNVGAASCQEIRLLPVHVHIDLIRHFDCRSPAIAGCGRVHSIATGAISAAPSPTKHKEQEEQYEDDNQDGHYWLLRLRRSSRIVYDRFCHKTYL